jgi:hypothetical protein
MGKGRNDADAKASGAGGRGPSSKLHALVRRLSEDQFRQLSAYSNVYGADSKKFKLIALLRSMVVYDTETERTTFPDPGLRSLRHAAGKWILRTLHKLGIHVSAIVDAIGMAEVALEMECFEEALEFVKDAKSIAVSCGSVEWMPPILKLEKRIALKCLAPEDALKSLGKIQHELQESAQSIQFLVEFEGIEMEYFHTTRTLFRQTGEIDLERINEYFRSGFGRADSTQWPVGLRRRKLLMEEYLLKLSGEKGKACKVAEELLVLSNADPPLPATALADLLWRLLFFYEDLGELDKAENVLSEFEKRMSGADKEIYLGKYLIGLFQFSFDSGLHSHADMALEISLDEVEFIRDRMETEERSLLLLFIATHAICVGNIRVAAEFFKMLPDWKADGFREQYRVQYMTIHLILLLENGDDTGMESSARSYLRYLKKMPYFATPAKEVLSFLQGEVYQTEKPSPKNKPETLVSRLRAFQAEKATSRAFWYATFFLWVDRRWGA